MQRRYLGHHIGCYVSEIGVLNQVIHMWGFASMADREVRRARMEQDPEWIAFLEMNAGTFTVQETRILRATSFSPQLILPAGATLKDGHVVQEEAAAIESTRSADRAIQFP